MLGVSGIPGPQDRVQAAAAPTRRRGGGGLKVYVFFLGFRTSWFISGSGFLMVWLCFFGVCAFTV